MQKKKKKKKWNYSYFKGKYKYLHRYIKAETTKTIFIEFFYIKETNDLLSRN